MVIKPEIKQIEDLAGKVRESDKRAFNKLFNLLWEQLFVFAQSIIMDESKAKDIVQEIWIDYWNRRHNIENKHIRAYLYQAVRYKIYNHLRDSKYNNVQLAVINELPINSKIEEHYNLEDTLFLVNDSIKNLPLRCKEIFTLSRLEGIPNSEIAERLGISKRTVENQISIALKAVNKNLKKTFKLVLFFI
ncbi:RNA polymerase sigma factor [Flavivirga sp. 57AJ16]|uniref:RNA polymerase sigma factor n=1 Tax=Flavivirga sp. 57AJ16 TaxID=3025307 RepID=UPI0023654475|nr:RNA polymerase sigma-70 factor [Flavivirga sp. 57AJ16]MDD7885392.1 RNA polymerase sigma-70 factor [Flavivirga sp. 57AJ16]